ncbi:hypothetical protein [Gymnodinialimonas sp. 57CJ19]|uniref:hypothetical protein n=1 Tax=Gymnodinialimonas sp. 57CJ19 TaxID=3138498 RepID=UPI003134264B
MRFLSLAALALVPLPATAQTSAEMEVLPRLIASACFDLVEERHGCETVVLLTSETEPDTADLLIFSDRRANAPHESLAVARNIAFNGPMFGQSPSLAQAENGSLQVIEEQIGIGRFTWTNELTIAYRDGAFVMAGQTYSTYDRIMGGSYSCDTNLLTGDWIASAERPDPDETQDAPIFDVTERGQIAGAHIALSQWNPEQSRPQPCDDVFTAWYEAAPQ